MQLNIAPILACSACSLNELRITMVSCRAGDVSGRVTEVPLDLGKKQDFCGYVWRLCLNVWNPLMGFPVDFCSKFC